MNYKNTMRSSTTVLFVQRRLPHYRASFFDALRLELATRGCQLRLVYGDPNQEELSKKDSGELVWAEKLITHYFFGGKVCWQPFAKKICNVDLVICSHENKLIFNLIVQYFYPKVKVALFGHGANLQGAPQSWKEKLKRIIAKRADWWFGYTCMSLPHIRKFEFPENRVTIINNSIDTEEMAKLYSQVSQDDLDTIKNSIGIKGSNVGIFIGSLYDEKRIDFILIAIKNIRSIMPDFEMIIAGDGVQKNKVVDFCIENNWVKYVGLCTGKQKVDLLAISKVMINPGLVGLGILDSFVCAVPMLTTDCGFHSPEIAYLENGKNGVITENTLDSYTESVIYLLRNNLILSEMKKACLESGRKYSIQNMACHFADGIMNCLAAPKYRGSH